MLIPRRKRQVLKQKEAKEEGGDDELQDKIRITGTYIFSISFLYYSIGVETVRGRSTKQQKTKTKQLNLNLE